MSNTRTATAPLTAISAGKVRWIEGGLVGAFQSGAGFCVRKGDTFLSFNGTRPSVWGRKSTAVEIADTMIDDGSVTWVPAAP